MHEPVCVVHVCVCVRRRTPRASAGSGGFSESDVGKLNDVEPAGITVMLHYRGHLLACGKNGI